jgi:HSP20 family protein
MAQVPATTTSQGGRMAARREHPLERLRQDFDTLFGRLMGGRLAPLEQDFGSMRMWDFDVTENDKEISVRAELPGFEQNELDVQLNKDVLTIKAEKEQKDKGHEEYTSFYRSITLPPGIDADMVQATYHNGVLELHVPRAEGSQPKRINVQAQAAAETGDAKQPQPAKTRAGNGATQAGSKPEQSGTAATQQTKK